MYSIQSYKLSCHTHTDTISQIDGTLYPLSSYYSYAYANMRHPSASGHHYYLNSFGEGAVTGDSDRHTTALEPATMQSKVIRMNKQPSADCCTLLAGHNGTVCIS